jgi:hypothetical protein
MENAAKPGNQVPVLPKRREARMPVALNVRILGIDANGKAFHQAVVTADISLSGARVVGLTAQLNHGDIVGLQSGGEKCRFKVSWISKNDGGTFEVGLHCLEKGTSPWRDTMLQAKSGDRRGNDRFPCNGSASVHSADFSTPIWGSLRDISAGGCYVQCVNPAAVGDIVSGQFVVNGLQINGVAEVRTSRASVGMGLQWCDLGWDGQEKLNNLLRSLSLNHTETNSNKVKALSQLDKLHQLVSALRERLESNHALVDVQMIGRLSDALERLTDALKSVQS